MMSSIVPLEDNKASRLMRAAILHELHCPLGDPAEPAADKLQLVARSLVSKAAQGDVSAIKEVLDRIDGKTLPRAPESDDGSDQGERLMGEARMMHATESLIAATGSVHSLPPRGGKYVL